MGNTGGRDKAQPSTVDDSGPTLLQSHTGLVYQSRLTDSEGNRYAGTEDEEFDMAHHLQTTNISPAYAEDPVQRKLPSVVRWDGAGQSAFVTFDDGQTKIPLVRSQNNFYTIVDLPEGTHSYRFLIDGQWRCDPKEPRDGTCQNNIVSVRASDFEVFEALAVDSIGTESAKTTSTGSNTAGLSNSPPGSYSQSIPQKYGSPSPPAPPTLPPQLLQVILNTETPLQCEPTVLPEPNHVMLNHLYALSIKDGVMVMSGTHRYRKKYVTTLLYKPTN